MINECSEAKENAVMKDTIWSFCFSQLESTPMWVGFHNNMCIDKSEK